MDPDIVPTTPAHISLTRTQSHLGVVQVGKWILARQSGKEEHNYGWIPSLCHTSAIMWHQHVSGPAVLSPSRLTPTMGPNPVHQMAQTPALCTSAPALALWPPGSYSQRPCDLAQSASTRNSLTYSRWTPASGHFRCCSQPCYDLALPTSMPIPALGPQGPEAKDLRDLAPVTSRPSPALQHPGKEHIKGINWKNSRQAKLGQC